jgi:hypothetical protein
MQRTVSAARWTFRRANRHAGLDIPVGKPVVPGSSSIPLVDSIVEIGVPKFSPILTGLVIFGPNEHSCFSFKGDFSPLVS